MEIKVKVSDFFNFKDFEICSIQLDFYGVINDNENVSFYAKYNFSGELIGCSSPYSACNKPDYYIAIAEYFKLMKEYQGEKILKIIDQLKEILSPFEAEVKELNIKTLELTKASNKTKNEYQEQLKILNRLRKPERKEAQLKVVSELKEKYDNLSEELEKIDDEANVLFAKINNLKKIEIQ